MDRPTCKTCPYWDEFGVFEIDGDDDASSAIGFCKRYPPRINDSLLRDHINDDDADVFVPFRFSVSLQTAEYDFCGEHPEFPAWIEAQKKGEASE